MRFSAFHGWNYAWANLFAPYIKGSKTVLDSGSHAVDSGFQWLDSRSFPVELGFRIPIVGGIPDSYSCIPDSRVQDCKFHTQKFPGFRNPESLTRDEIPLSNKQWNAIHLSNPTYYIRSYVMMRVTLFRQNENQFSADISSRKSDLKEKYPPDIKRLSSRDNKHK